MIINNNKQILEVSGDDFMTIQSKVNKSKLAKLYGLLSNIYKNPIGAIVREYASNAYDANKEAYNFKTMEYADIVKKYTWMVDPNKSDINISEVEFLEIKDKLKRTDENEPVVAGFYKKGEEVYFYIKDFGVGLSPKRMMFIYFDYLSSTKEETNDELGGFGIGAKSALAYTNVFEIDTNYNGVNYKYIMSKGAKGIPEGNLLHKSEFDESLENGTTIKIKLKNNSDSGDISMFFHEIKNQLPYMDNLYVDTDYLSTISQYRYAEDVNDYKIYTTGNWMIRNNSPIDEMHLCLGNITYDIDWNEIGVRTIYSPIALKFEIGELEPTPSRESIVYDEETRQLIRDRITQVQDYYYQIYSESITEPKTLYDYFELKARNTDLITFDGYDVDMSSLMGDRTYKLKLEYPAFKDMYIVPSDLFKPFRCRRKISRYSGKVEVYKYDILTSRQIKDRFISGNYSFIFNGKEDYEFEQLHTKYLAENVCPNDDIFIIDEDPKFNYENYLSSYGYSSNSDYLSAYSSYKDTVVDFIRSGSINHKNHIPDPNWYHKYYAGNSRFSLAKKVKVKGTISSLTTNNGRHFYRETITLDVYNFKDKLVIFSKMDDKVKLGEIVNSLVETESLNHYGAVVGMAVAKTNYELLKKMDNTVALEDVFEKVRTFRRIVTCHKIKENKIDLYSKCKWILDANDDLKLAYASVELYMKQNGNASRFLSDSLMQELVSIADAHGYYDEDILDSFNFVQDYVSGLDVLNYLDNDWFKEQVKNLEEGEEFKTPKALMEYVMLKGKRVSNKYYLKPESVEHLFDEKYINHEEEC